MGKADATHRLDTAGVIAPPPVIFLITLIVGLIAQMLRPVPFLTHSITARIVGGGLAVSGLALSAWVMRLFGRAGTPVTPSSGTRRLVVVGPYRFSRNPDYIGQTLLTIGLALLLGAPWALLFLVPALLLIHYGVIAGERRWL
jgi:protein-S-isoprenylcysteine O-methyltransferase Ste14